MTHEELLNFAITNGMLDTTLIQQEYDMANYLSKHPYAIWQGKNGRWYSYLPDNKKGRKQIVKTSKQDIEKIIIDYWKDQDKNPTIEELFDEWLTYKVDVDKIKKSTRDRYQQDYNLYLSSMGNWKIYGVTSLDIEDYLKKIIHENEMTDKRFCNLKTILKGVFVRAKKRGYVDFNIREVLEDLDVPRNAFKKTPRDDDSQIFYAQEEEKIINYIMDNQTSKNMALLFMFKTGMRIGEVVSLKREDIGDNTIYVHRTETRYKDDNGNDVFDVDERPKTEAGIRHIIVKDDYVWMLKKMKEQTPENEYVFIHKGRRCTTQIIRRQLQSICKKLDIKPKSTHKIRKTYGTKLYDSGIPKSIICQQMGHTDISCLEKHYYRVRQNDEEKAQAINSIPEL